MTLSLPTGRVRLVTLSIRLLVIVVTISLLFSFLFVFMTFSLLPVWARLATMDTHCLFVCSYYSLSFICSALGLWWWVLIVCSSLRPSLFCYVELGLWQWALSGCSFLRPSLFYALWKCPSICSTCISSSLICDVHVPYSCTYDPPTLLWMPALTSHRDEGFNSLFHHGNI